MEHAGINSSITTQVGAATTVGSGVIVIFGQTLSQVQIALISMVAGVLVGVTGLIANIIFKYLAHREQCRINDITLGRLGLPKGKK
jgi:hypothetical protein